MHYSICGVRVHSVALHAAFEFWLGRAAATEREDATGGIRRCSRLAVGDDRGCSMSR
jgi:hypothetical protein